MHQVHRRIRCSWVIPKVKVRRQKAKKNITKHRRKEQRRAPKSTEEHRALKDLKDFWFLAARMLLVVMPGATNGVLAPSSDALVTRKHLTDEQHCTAPATRSPIPAPHRWLWRRAQWTQTCDETRGFAGTKWVGSWQLCIAILSA